MAEVQIQKLRITHEMILNWLLLNPEKSQGECAKLFGVTEAWLSVIINSDCFQERLAQKRHLMDRRVTDVIEAKMRGVVDAGLDRLDKIVPVSTDPEFILNTTDKLLGRLGYGPKSASPGFSVNVQNNTYTVPREVLEASRKLITGLPVAPRVELLDPAEPLDPADVR